MLPNTKSIFYHEGTKVTTAGTAMNAEFAPITSSNLRFLCVFVVKKMASIRAAWNHFTVSGGNLPNSV